MDGGKVRREPSGGELRAASGGRWWLRASTVGFHVLHQEAEGALWRPVLDDRGQRIRLPPRVTPADVLRMVGARRGVYQLLPIDAEGWLSQNPPQMFPARGPQADEQDARLARPGCV